MNTKKDIGSQIKTLLENQNVSPSHSLWSNLEEELKRKKKKRKLSLIWLSSGLVSITLLIFMFFGNPFGFNEKTIINKNSVNNKNLTKNPDDKNGTVNTDAKNPSPNNNKSINQAVKNPNSNRFNQPEIATSKTDKTLNDSVKKATLNDNALIQATHKSFNKTQKGLVTTKNSSLSRSENPNKKHLNPTKTHRLSSSKKKKNASTSQKTIVKTVEKIKTDTENNLNPESYSSIDNSAFKTLNKQEKLTEKSLNHSIVSSTEKEDKKEKNTPKSLNQPIALNPEKEQEIEKEEKAKEEEKKKKEEKKPSYKWVVFPHASLDLYDRFDNSFSNNITVNYGVYFSYFLNPDIVFRTGINNLKFQYNDIENNDSVSQELRYLEIPLEIKHKIIDKKISTSVVYGLSYLLLNDAVIKTDLNTFSNKSSFENATISLNLGFSLQKRLNKRLYFNVEPIFKSQFKPLAEDNANFSIFTTSIITGIEYKF